jgi:hypothetical protein
VKLKVKEITVGEFELNQAILVPEDKLVVGMDYRLFIDNLPEYILPLRNKTNQTTTYYLTPDKEFFSIGHGMCSGAFRFREGQEFKATFDLVDASRNINIWSDAKVKFEKPAA